MAKIESLKGVSDRYKAMVDGKLISSYATKSESFRQVIKSEKDMLALYESVMLNGSAGSAFTDLMAGIKGVNPSDTIRIKNEVYAEIKKDVDTISKNSHMIRTKECPRNKLYYNGDTVKGMMNKMADFMSSSTFFSKLSSENRKALISYLKIDAPMIDTTDPDYETKCNKYYETEIKKVVDKQLLPFIEKINSDGDFKKFLDASARIANKQMDKKNVPVKFTGDKSSVSIKDAQNTYDLVEFMSNFNVKNGFEPEKIKKEMCAKDTSMVDTADKSKEFTDLDIRMIFANAEKYNKKFLLTPVEVEGEIFTKPSDKKLAEAGLSYDQAIKEILTGLQQVQKGATYKSLRPEIIQYVKLLMHKCPNMEFLPNLNLSEADSCRLSATNNASEIKEPVGNVEKYLVDGPRFSKTNVEDMVKKITQISDLSKLIYNSKGEVVISMDKIARVMNDEVSARFLTENEKLLKLQLEDYYFMLSDEEKEKFITPKDKYIEDGNTLLTKDDLKVLFQCFAEHMDENPQFKMFKLSPRDFTSSESRVGKMAHLGCTYEEFFDKLHEKYLDAVKKKAIFCADDEFAPFLRQIMSYCPDVTYAPSVGMTCAVNGEEFVYEPDDDVNTAIVLPVVDRTYASLVLSLPSNRDVPAFNSSIFLVSEEERIIKDLKAEYDEKKKIKDKRQNIIAKIMEIKHANKDKEMSVEDIAKIEYLEEKLKDITRQLRIIENRIRRIKETLKKVMGDNYKDELFNFDEEVKKAENVAQSENADANNIEKVAQEAEAKAEKAEKEAEQKEEKSEEKADADDKKENKEEKKEAKDDKEKADGEEEEKEPEYKYVYDKQLEKELEQVAQEAQERHISKAKLSMINRSMKAFMTLDEEEELEEVEEDKKEEMTEVKQEEKAEEVVENKKPEKVEEVEELEEIEEIKEDELEEIDSNEIELEEIKETKKVQKETKKQTKAEEEEMAMTMAKEYKPQ